MADAEPKGKSGRDQSDREAANTIQFIDVSPSASPRQVSTDVICPIVDPLKKHGKPHRPVRAAGRFGATPGVGMKFTGWLPEGSGKQIALIVGLNISSLGRRRGVG